MVRFCSSSVLTFISVLFTLFYVLCRSDPTENDSVEGLRPNARGPGLVTFGVCVLLFSSNYGMVVWVYVCLSVMYCEDASFSFGSTFSIFISYKSLILSQKCKY